MRSCLNVAPDFEINCQDNFLSQAELTQKRGKTFSFGKLKLLIKNVKATATNAFLMDIYTFLCCPSPIFLFIHKAKKSFHHDRLWLKFPHMYYIFFYSCLSADSLVEKHFNIKKFILMTI